MKKLTMQTPDLTEGNVTKIAQLFPNVITEKEGSNGVVEKAVDFELLKQALSKELVEDDNERYRLDWPGKKASLLKANTPITKTLRPDRESSVNFDTTENVFIEGDNFEVLKVLQESYLGKIKMIYIDPPYNTGKDFVYKDNFTKSKDEYDEEIGVEDEEGGKLFRNTDTNGRFHSDWLSMMYERLLIARDLLKDDGVIFISIDDNEVTNLKKIGDEIFGENNFLGQMVWHSRGRSKTIISIDHEYVLCYAKSVANIVASYDKEPNQLANWYGQYIERKYDNPDNDPRGLWRDAQHTVTENKAHYTYSINSNTGEVIEGQVTNDEIWYGHETWMYPISTIKKLFEDNRLFFKKNKERLALKVKKFISEEEAVSSLEGLIQRDDISSRHGTEELEPLFKNVKVFAYPKPTSLILRLIKASTNSNDIILDFFAGSGTTAHAVMLSNIEDNLSRRFVVVQIPEIIDPETTAKNEKVVAENAVKFLKENNLAQNLASLSYERIRRAGKKILEENAETLALREKPLDVGFRAYKADTTNMKDVYYHPSQVVQEGLFNLVSNIKEDRTPEDLLTQVILNLGLTLDLPIEKKELRGNAVYFVASNALVACFDDNIDFDIVDEIAKYEPLKVVFKDASFKEEQDRTNVDTRMKRLSPETIITVL